MVFVLYWVGALGYYSNDFRKKASAIAFGPITVARMWRVVFFPGSGHLSCSSVPPLW